MILYDKRWVPYKSGGGLFCFVFVGATGGTGEGIFPALARALEGSQVGFLQSRLLPYCLPERVACL